MALTDCDRIRLDVTVRGAPERGGDWHPIAWAGDIIQVEGSTRRAGQHGRETHALIMLDDGTRWWVNAELVGGDPV